MNKKIETIQKVTIRKQKDLRNAVEHLERENQYLREERDHDLHLLKNKELKINELKGEIEEKDVLIFQLRRQV